MERKSGYLCDMKQEFVILARNLFRLFASCPRSKLQKVVVV